MISNDSNQMISNYLNQINLNQMITNDLNKSNHFNQLTLYCRVIMTTF